MSHHPKRRAMLACLAAAAITGTAFASTAAATVAAPDVPAPISIDAGNKPYLVGHAVGDQIYSCNITANGPKWALLAPRADLYGDNDKVIATHFGGPTWQANDGSSVKAQRVDGVTVDATAIPWLKLKVTSAAAGPGGDRLTHTTYVQRINTTGGLEPAASDCSADSLGAQRAVPYTADYVFWKEQA